MICIVLTNKNQESTRFGQTIREFEAEFPLKIVQNHGCVKAAIIRLGDGENTQILHRKTEI